MLTSAPHIPCNLKQKLTAAVRPFQREYDNMSLGDARRLLGRHGFRMPVLCSLVFHGNGSLKRVNIRENLKCHAASSWQIAANLSIFASPEQGANDLWSSCFFQIVEDAATQYIKDARHRAATLSDADIEALLRRVLDYEHRLSFDFRDASLLVIRRVAEAERNIRKSESNHARLIRHAQPLPSGFLEELEAEREAAFASREEEIARGRTPYYSFDYESWPEEERVVLAYRERCYRIASR